MAVYVDNMLMQADVPNGARTHSSQWSHLMADTTEELIAFAKRIGLKQQWIQYPGTWKEHFDVTKPKRALALRCGAIPLEIQSPEWLAFVERKREAAGNGRDPD